VSAAANVANWNHILALGGIPGMGLFVDPPLPTSATNGNFQVFVEGSTTAAITKNVTVENEMNVNTRTQGNSGKDFAIRFSMRRVTAGMRGLNPMLLTLDVKERNR